MDMYTLKFTYQNGTNKYFEHINEVQYVRASAIVVSGENIQKHLFPIGYDLHLFANGLNVTVSGKDLLYIEVEKEN